MTPVILLIAPAPCFVVESGDTPKHPLSYEVGLYELVELLYSPFRKRTHRFTEFHLKTNHFHKPCVFHVSDRFTVGIPSSNLALHVVRQHMLRRSHTLNCMEHADKKILRALRNSGGPDFLEKQRSAPSFLPHSGPFYLTLE